MLFSTGERTYNPFSFRGGLYLICYSSMRLFETKGNTKGTEFLLQNTLGYASKSEVNSKQELEVTEKQRIKQLPDEEVEGRLQRLAPKIVAITSKKAQ